MDHMIIGDAAAPDPLPEAYTLLGGIGARTTTARLGTLVTAVTFRNPALVAKMTTTLDVISGGRAMLGIGAGNNGDEHRRYGVPFPPIAERLERLEDALRIARAMFRDDNPTYAGRHHSIDGAVNWPPPRHGTIPVVVGGNGERHALRLAALYGDACNLTVGDPREIRRKLAALDRHCEAIGRDPATVGRTRAASLVMDADPKRAARVAERLRAAIGMEPERFAHYAIAGTPEQVCERIAIEHDAGLEGFVFNIPEALGIDAVRLSGETLRAAFG
jgi:alkanesulfonate monooxygenase SsuD/methylene tetrahydromethanopterin reductase-like flavin-dependent oxidoreductase (luciferase family)